MQVCMMTLPESSEITAKDCTKKQMNIGMAVKNVLLKATEEERITYGVYSCAKLLEVNPESVALCILPESVAGHDVSIRIQNTLMEAHCVEHGVRVLKIDSSEKLKMLLTCQTGANNNEAAPLRLSTDYTCVLVQYPKEKSPADEFVLSYCDPDMQDELFTHDPLELPV